MKKKIFIILTSFCFAMIYFESATAQLPPVFSEPNVSGVPEIPVIENTQWIIDGITYKSVDVAIAKYQKEQLCIIKVVIDNMPSDSEQPLAKKIALYAFKHGYYDRAKQNNIGNNYLPRIGVALMIPDGNGQFKGFRYQFSIVELKKDLSSP